MSQIDLHQFDLNLLVVFETLMVERNVTRAAERLGRTQSAVSHSLARLRALLDDPLLIKAGRRMEPTPFALALIEQAAPLLGSLKRMLSPRPAFDPATSRRVFRLNAPDVALTLFADLLSDLRASAPQVAVEWTGPRDSMLLELAEGRIDLAIAPSQLRLPEGIIGAGIGSLGWRCFARRGHPAFSRWSTRSWSRWPHLVVRFGDRLDSPVNRAIAEAGLARRIAGWVPNFSVVAPMLAASELLATLPALAMADALAVHCLDHRPVPFAIDPLPHALLWSVAHNKDPGIVWLRGRLRPILRRRFAS